MDYKKILEKEIERLSNAMKQIESMNIIDYNSQTLKKQMQGKINKCFSLIVDVKMDLEKIVGGMKNE